MNYNIVPTLRTDKIDKKGFAPIYLFIYEGSKLITKQPIGQKVTVQFWDVEARQVKKAAPLSTLINALILSKKTTLTAKFMSEEISGSGSNVAEVMNRGKNKDLDFFSFARKQIKEKKYADETRRAYGIVLDKIEAYRKHLKISQVDYAFLQGFEAHLRDNLKNDVNTIWGNFKVINTFINDAIKLNLIKDNPFDIYNRPKYKQGPGTFLNAEELTSWENFANTTLDGGFERVSKYYLFMARTGLRFSDASRFDPAKHIIDGVRIVLETQKTHNTTNILINEKIKPLIEYISNNPLGITQTYFNRVLKVIAAHLGIAKKVSSHTGRHSFGASLVALGVPEKVAQGLLTHSTAAATKIYFHLSEPSLDEAMRKFNNQ